MIQSFRLVFLKLRSIDSHLCRKYNKIGWIRLSFKIIHINFVILISIILIFKIDTIHFEQIIIINI